MRDRRTDVRVICSDSSGTLIVEVADPEFVNIAYSQLDKFPTNTQGNTASRKAKVVRVASMGFGAIG